MEAAQEQAILDRVKAGSTLRDAVDTQELSWEGFIGNLMYNPELRASLADAIFDQKVAYIAEARDKAKSGSLREHVEGFLTNGRSRF